MRGLTIFQMAPNREGPVDYIYIRKKRLEFEESDLFKEQVEKLQFKTAANLSISG